MYVYLAGPITGCSYEEATEWRAYVTEKLERYARLLSPMRDKDFLIMEQNIEDHCEEWFTSTVRGIRTRDQFDVMRADVILANLLHAKKPSIGTVCEIAWAHLLQKPIVLVMEDGNPHDHGFIRDMANFIVDDLDRAIQIVRNFV